jgi:protein-S-isoprenylcysteine O-methyltransferase Ste14
MLKQISKIALPVLGISILYLMLSGNFFSRSPFVVAGQLLAVALSVWARRSFKSGQFSVHAEPLEGTLLRTGPYQVIRHPMYAAALLLIWSSVFGHLSLVTAIIGFVITCIIAVRIVTEEQFLRSRFPEYAEYSRTTKRVIPFLI